MSSHVDEINALEIRNSVIPSVNHVDHKNGRHGLILCDTVSAIPFEISTIPITSPNDNHNDDDNDIDAAINNNHHNQNLISIANNSISLYKPFVAEQLGQLLEFAPTPRSAQLALELIARKNVTPGTATMLLEQIIGRDPDHMLQLLQHIATQHQQTLLNPHHHHHRIFIRTDAVI